MKESFFGGLLLGLALLGWCTLVWWALIGGEKLIDFLKPEVSFDNVNDYHVNINLNDEYIGSITCDSPINIYRAWKIKTN